MSYNNPKKIFNVDVISTDKFIGDQKDKEYLYCNSISVKFSKKV